MMRGATSVDACFAGNFPIRAPRHASLRVGWLAGLTSCFTIATSFAAPPVIFEEARLVPQDGAPEGPFGVASDIDGNIAVVSAASGSSVPELAGPGAAYVFERGTNGIWRQTAKLLPANPDEWSNFGLSVAISGNTIVGSAFRSGGHVFERSASGWTRTATLHGGYFVDIDGGTIIESRDGAGAALYTRSANGWNRIAILNNGYAMPDIDYEGNAVAISGGTAVHGSFGIDDWIEGTPSGEAYVYLRGANGVWPLAPASQISRPLAPPGSDGFSRFLAVSGTTFVAGGRGAYIFERNAQGAWQAVRSIPDGDGVAIDGTTVLARTREGLVRMYRRATSGTWNHVATLASSSDEGLGAPNLHGNRAIAGASVFTLPATLTPTPAIIQEDLEDNAANNWQPEAMAQFSIVSAGGTRVYRQTNTTGDARAIFTTTDVENQSVQADITPRAFAAGGERWAGLIARYTNGSNYYYVTLRNTNVIQLKRMVNGSFQTMASAPYTFALNKTHRVRLEAHGKLIRVLIGDRVVVSAIDDALSRGRVGIAMYKTQADFDNFLVSQNPRVYLENEDFAYYTPPWLNVDPGSTDGLPNWYPTYDELLKQYSLAGDARAINGEPATDQIIEARARAIEFASGGERWFGLLARWIDRSNYYYVTVRNTNIVSLRKMKNGVATVLDSAPLTVTPNTWYRLRMDVIGNKLRVYVNGTLSLEATDSTPHAQGSHGVATYKTTAEVDDYVVIQP